MKRKSSGTFGFILLCGIVIVAGLGAGYFFVGSHQKTSIPVEEAPPIVAETPPAAPIHPRRIAAAGEYTAPGAPSIAISELKGEAPTREPKPDPEASETGLPTPTTPPVLSNNSPDMSDTTGTPPTDATPTATGDDAPQTPPTDTDANTPPADPGNGQTDTTDTTTGPVFHVQAGIFVSERNAKILADALKRRGYTAVAEPSTDDSGKTMYRVQVGVYRSKTAASDAVLDLQRTGYPASLSTK